MTGSKHETGPRPGSTAIDLDTRIENDTQDSSYSQTDKTVRSLKNGLVFVTGQNRFTCFLTFPEAVNRSRRTTPLTLRRASGV